MQDVSSSSAWRDLAQWICFTSCLFVNTASNTTELTAEHEINNMEWYTQAGKWLILRTKPVEMVKPMEEIISTSVKSKEGREMSQEIAL